MKKVTLIVRNLKGYTTNGNARKVVSIVEENSLQAMYSKIDNLRYSEKEGGYLIYGGLDENLFKFEPYFKVTNIIRLN